jgi:hypothetical protein
MMKYHARCSLPGSTTQYQPAIGFRVFDLADEAWYSNIRSDEVFGAPPGYGGFGAVRRLPEEWTIPSPSNPRQGTLVVGIDCPGENVGSAAPLHTRNVYVTIPDADVAAGSYLLPAFTINR